MKLRYLTAGLLAILLAACQDNKKQPQADFFPDTRTSTVRKNAFVQSANGARQDGMLYARHFDGEQLSSLGKQKLSLMLGDEAGAKPLTVYLVDAGAGDLLEKRKTAVRSYLKDALRPDERVEIVDGTNPATHHPAAETLPRLAKTESGKADEGGSGAMTDQPSVQSPSAPGNK